MNTVGKQYIKYLGEMRLLDELISADGLSETELLDEVSKFYIKMSKQITKERTEIYQKSLGVVARSIRIDKIGKPVGRHVPDRSIRGICSVFHVDRLTFFLGHRKEDYNRN